MSHDEYIKKTPLHVLHSDPDTTPYASNLGLIMARAGLGKTSVLVQLAIDSILRGQKVLHVSIGEGLHKAKAWYDDIFKYIIADYNLGNPLEVGEEIMLNRMIMTFRESVFSRPRLEERLNDLIYQNIFRPDVIIVDGFDFEQSSREEVLDLKELIMAMEIEAWFSSLRHREDNRVSALGVPAPCHEMEDVFETIIVLEPQKQGVALDIIKSRCTQTGKVLRLDPSTMMIKGM